MINPSKMRRNGLKMSNFGGKWRFSAGAAVEPPFFSKIRIGNTKSQLLSVITYPLTIKMNSMLTVNANVSDLPPPYNTVMH